LAAAVILALLPIAIASGLDGGLDPTLVIVAGLGAFGVVFAINSALHSYLILAYSNADEVSLNVGFYYMANAGGRLTGTVLSGWVYQSHGLAGCLWWSAAFVLAAAVLSAWLPEFASETVSSDGCRVNGERP
jgi:predicted MFS family arabinose efflux permease